MNRLLIILVLGAIGCAADSNSPDAVADDNYPKISQDSFSQIEDCSKRWSSLVSEWKANGGGISDSLKATKFQIANDQKSRFAQLVREVWRDPVKPKKGTQLWGWPVSIDVSRETGFALSTRATKYVGEDCASTSWLDPLLWNELRFVNKEPSNFRIPREAPTDITWGPRSLPAWTLYWLLTPTK